MTRQTCYNLYFNLFVIIVILFAFSINPYICMLSYSILCLFLSLHLCIPTCIFVSLNNRYLMCQPRFPFSGESLHLISVYPVYLSTCIGQLFVRNGIATFDGNLKINSLYLHLYSDGLMLLILMYITTMYAHRIYVNKFVEFQSNTPAVSDVIMYNIL